MEKCAKFAHWLLRLAFASVFLYHGLTKFPRAAGMAGMLNLPLVVVYILATAEALGGLFVLIGGFGVAVLTRLGGLLIMPIMLVVIFKYHWGQWAFVASETHPLGGIEFQVVLLAMALYFLIRGNEA